MKNLIFTLFLLTTFSGFSQTKKPSGNNDGTTTVGCEIVEKGFVNKAGKLSDYKEVYLRCSIQDYFIKFCESKVSLKKMKKYIDKSAVVTYEVKEGSWDICEGDPEMQSRIGTYAIVLSIKKKKKVRAKF